MRERLGGAFAFIVGSGMLYASFVMHLISQKVMCAAPVFLCWGLWVTAVGEPKDEKGQPRPWAQVGAWVAGLVGMLAALVIATWFVDWKD